MAQLAAAVKQRKKPGKSQFANNTGLSDEDKEESRISKEQATINAEHKDGQKQSHMS